MRQFLDPQNYSQNFQGMWDTDNVRIISCLGMKINITFADRLLFATICQSILLGDAVFISLYSLDGYSYHLFYPLLDIHLQNVTMCFRAAANYEIVKPIGEVGWRIKKDYFQVRILV